MERRVFGVSDSFTPQQEYQYAEHVRTVAQSVSGSFTPQQEYRSAECVGTGAQSAGTHTTLSRERRYAPSVNVEISSGSSQLRKLYYNYDCAEMMVLLFLLV